jgi:hypothetical protein
MEQIDAERLDLEVEGAGRAHNLINKSVLSDSVVDNR